MRKQTTLGALVGALFVVAACADDRGALPPGGPMGPEPPGDGPPPTTPPPDAAPAVEVFFHSLTPSLNTPFFRGDMNGGKADVSPNLVHHGGLIAVESSRMYFATGMEGSFRQLPHGDRIQSESVVCGSGQVFTNLQMARGEQLVSLALNANTTMPRAGKRIFLQCIRSYFTINKKRNY